MEALVRARTLRGFEACVRHRGGAPDTLLARSGLSAEDLADEEAWLPFRSVLQAYENASKALNDPAFGMNLIYLRDLTFMGPMYLAARHAPDLRQAIADVVRYIRVQNTAFNLSLTVKREEGMLNMLLPPALRQHANQWIEESLATARPFCLIMPPSS